MDLFKFFIINERVDGFLDIFEKRNNKINLSNINKTNIFFKFNFKIKLHRLLFNNIFF